jgi:hypothetical protein
MLAAAGLSAGAVYAVYHARVSARMEEMKRMLDEYIPLASQPLSDPNSWTDPGEEAATPGGSEGGVRGA